MKSLYNNIQKTKFEAMYFVMRHLKNVKQQKSHGNTWKKWNGEIWLMKPFINVHDFITVSIFIKTEPFLNCLNFDYGMWS